MNMAEIIELDLANDLLQGLHRGEFSVLLQPKVSVATGNVVGAELLSRWQHPRFGMIAPDVWVVMAESQGLMRELTEWLVNKALNCMHLRHQQAGPFQFAINVCPSVFDYKLIDFIGAQFAQAGASPQSLELEITESVQARCLDTLGDAVRYAQAIGFRVALDDFGTGFNSMNYLVDLPVNTVKIDRGIVQKITGNRSATLVCSTLVGLAHEINAQVVCEGVETEAQYEAVAHMGTDMVQGFLFGKPMSIEVAGLYLNGGSPNPRSLRDCN
jgi:EAL domain-containing protein (putative c-di-GMP-specific phosphodiesterase class I)